MIAAKCMGPRATALPDRLHGDLPLRGSGRSLKALGIRKLQKDINWESDADRLVVVCIVVICIVVTLCIFKRPLLSVSFQHGTTVQNFC